MARRHNKQSFACTGGGQTNPLDALRAALFAGTAAPYDAPNNLGVALEEADSVAVAISASPAAETVDGGDLVAFVFAPVDVNLDGSIATRRWCSLGINKAIPVGVRDGVVVFNRNELPSAGRLLVLPSGIATSAGATSVQLTYSSRRRES